MSQSQQSFTTSKAILNLQNNLITLGEFIGNIALALAVIVVAALLWKIFWHSLNKLTIQNINTARDDPIGPGHSILDNIKCLHRILKNLTNSESGYVQDQCGFQAFTYLFFLRRMIHLMAIFTFTDLFIWLPYMLIFDQPQHFSLVSTDNSNYLFRTFYTLWITVAVLYGLHDLKAYLRLLLKSRYFHTPRVSNNIVNNIKSKTMYVHFRGESRKLEILEVKTRLVQRLRVEDTILGIIQIPNNSKKIQLQYDYKIYEIVRSIGLHNFSSIWKIFKQTKSEVLRQRLSERRDRLFRPRNRRPYAIDNFIDEVQQQRQMHINSFLVAFQKISTCQELISQVEAQRGCCDFICQPRQRTDVESYYLDQYDNVKLTVSWAQQPQDVIWINIGAPQRVKLFKYVLFNGLSWLLIALGFVIIVLTQSREIINIPRILLPIMLSIINATLRWLISKSSQWQNCHFQYQLQMKQMKVLLIFFSLNVIGGSLVRDTLNLIDILRTGWGFIELFGLIYKRPDGFFYYIYIVNELALTILSALFKAGDIVPEVMDVNLTYEKNTQLRHHSKYGTNDIYRFGYMYSLDIIVFAVIFMYSASSPLIHFFGFAYFYGKYYVAGYTLVVFHKYEETCSNLRIVEKACDYLALIMVLVIFLIGISLMFDGQYSSVLILYFWEGVILYLMYKDKGQSFKDYFTDDLLRNHDITPHIKEWKRQYLTSMQPMRYEQFDRLNLMEEDLE